MFFCSKSERFFGLFCYVFWGEVGGCNTFKESSDSKDVKIRNNVLLDTGFLKMKLPPVDIKLVKSMVFFYFGWLASYIFCMITFFWRSRFF